MKKIRIDKVEKYESPEIILMDYVVEGVLCQSMTEDLDEEYGGW